MTQPSRARSPQWVMVLGDAHDTDPLDGQLDWSPVSLELVQGWLKLFESKKKHAAFVARAKRFMSVAQPGQLLLTPGGGMLIRVVDDFGDAKSPENCVNFGYDHLTGKYVDYLADEPRTPSVEPEPEPAPPPPADDGPLPGQTTMPF